jgi:glycosyltransferase involved in cell wall biosynthesis
MDLRDIHICISAYACDPTRGSEPGIGWNLVREVAKRHRAWAVTRRKNEVPITAELQRAPLPNLQMIYVDLPKPLRIWKKGHLGVDLYYRLWQRLIRPVIAKLDRQVGLDVTQHVTFGQYWTPTALAYLSTPFVWGPVGGGESAPAAFWRDFTARGRAYEVLRDMARGWGESHPSVRMAANRAALALAVTEETRARLLALGTRRVELFSALGLDRASYDELSRVTGDSRAPLRFISMGRLLHWKGFHLGLKAFSRAAIPDAEYWIVGDGPEHSNLVRLARDLGVSTRVRFCGSQTRSAALDLLAACDVLVHPSLHESGGWVCLEAMAAGKPVVCLDLGGPAALVTADTGIKVAADNPQQVVSDVARALTLLATAPDLRHSMSEAGRQRVQAEYIWDTKGQQLDALYRTVLDDTLSTPRAPVA